MDRSPLLVGIAGASGSGKTALCRALHERIGARACTVVEMDRYYHDLSHLAPEARDELDFDRPERLDIALLVSHLVRLSRGEAVVGPSYDFASHTRRPGALIRPASVVLVEGIFCLVPAELRRLLSWSVFVTVPDAICFERRLARDVHERGRDPAQARTQYERFVRPSAAQLVVPSSAHASRIVSGTRRLPELCDDVLWQLWLQGSPRRLHGAAA